MSAPDPPSSRDHDAGTDDPEIRVVELQEELAGRERQLQTRPVIDQAKGMLMQDFGFDQEGAFALLKRISQDSNVKLHDLAQIVVDDLRGNSSPATSQSAAETINGLADRLKHRTDPR